MLRYAITVAKKHSNSFLSPQYHKILWLNSKFSYFSPLLCKNKLVKFDYYRKYYFPYLIDWLQYSWYADCILRLMLFQMTGSLAHPKAENGQILK